MAMKITLRVIQQDLSAWNAISLLVAPVRIRRRDNLRGRRFQYIFDTFLQDLFRNTLRHALSDDPAFIYEHNPCPIFYAVLSGDAVTRIIDERRLHMVLMQKRRDFIFSVLKTYPYDLKP